MKNKLIDEENDFGAIGIGAMIVFIALILVAAVASAVIIQTGEKLQQNAQQSGSDTQREISGKISIDTIIIFTTAQYYLMYFETAPGSEPISSDSVHWQMSCSDGAYNYMADDFFDANIGVDQQPMSIDSLGTPAANGGGVVTTLDPGVPYAIYLDSNQMGDDCSATNVGVNGEITLWIHVAGGGSTFETLYVSDTANGAVVV